VQADHDGDGDLDLLVLRGAWLQRTGRHPKSRPRRPPPVRKRRPDRAARRRRPRARRRRRGGGWRGSAATPRARTAALLRGGPNAAGVRRHRR
jgi:hypothetical protein